MVDVDKSRKRVARDLAECAREPIRIPGAIQPHGRLMILDARSLTVEAISRNLADDLQLEPASLIGRGLARILDGDSAERARVLAAGEDCGGSAEMRLVPPAASPLWMGLVHRSEELTFIELEPAEPALSPDAMFDLLETGIERLRGAPATQDAAAVLVAAVRALTGFDRVKLYRFDQDWNGEVIAEEKVAGMQSYLGHAFPASDIPSQARALYTANRTRLISDAGYEPVPLIPDAGPAAARSIDLSGCVLRSVSPIHCEYLRNMGVVGSMSVSIVKEGSLWGLIACHHRKPHFVPHRIRRGCAMLAHAMEWHLEAAARAAASIAAHAIAQIRSSAMTESDADEPFAAALERAAPALMAVVDAQGFAWIDRQQILRCGILPGEAQLRALADRLQRETSAEPVYTDRLGEWFAPMRIVAASASGMAAHRIDENWALWFRPEWSHALTWAGNTKVPTYADAATGRIMPRRSFAAWIEKVRGRARPWSPDEIAAFADLRQLLQEANARESGRRLLELERRLAQGRRLEAIGTLAGGVAHELNNMLQPIQLLGGDLHERLVEGHDRQYLALILDAVGRARDLIRQLLEFSQAGKVDDTPVNLALLIERTVGEFRRNLPDGIRIERRIDLVPYISGDAVLLGTAIHNVLRNAGDAIGEVGVIAVDLASDTANPSGMPGPGIRLTIRDSGSGMNAETAARAFEPFFTTKPPGAGVGLGLAVAHSVVGRHGGSISLGSAPGAGTTVTIRLPLRSHAEGTPS